MAMAKPKMSSATRGNPYGRTGAPGKATEPPRDERQLRGPRDEADLYRMVGAERPMPSPAEQRLQAAPPPRPQPMPNLQALQRQAMPPQGGPPGQGMPPPGAPPAGPAGMLPQLGSPGLPAPGQQQMPPPMDPRVMQLRQQYGIR